MDTLGTKAVQISELLSIQEKNYIEDLFKCPD